MSNAAYGNSGRFTTMKMKVKLKLRREAPHKPATNVVCAE